MSGVQTLTFNQPTDHGGISRRTFLLPSASSGLPSQSSAASLTRSASVDTDDDNIFTDGDNKQSSVTRPPCISSSSVNLRRISLSSSTPVIPYTSPMQRRNSFSFSPSSSFDLGGSGSLQRNHMLMRSTTTLDAVDGAARREGSAMEQLERQRRDEISRRLRELRATAPSAAPARRLRQPSVEDAPAQTSTPSEQEPRVAVVKPTLGMPTIVRAPVRGLQPSMSAFQLRTRRDVLGSQSSATSGGSSPRVGPLRASWTIDAAARSTGGRLSTSDFPDDRTAGRFPSTDVDSLQRMSDAQPKATFQVANADNDDDNEQLVPRRRAKRDVKHDVNNNLGDPLGKPNNNNNNGDNYNGSEAASVAEKPTADNFTTSEIRLKVESSSDSQNKFSKNCEQSRLDVDHSQQNGNDGASVYHSHKNIDVGPAKNIESVESKTQVRSTPFADEEFVNEQHCTEQSTNKNQTCASTTTTSVQPIIDSTSGDTVNGISRQMNIEENGETRHRSAADPYHTEKENEPTIATVSFATSTSSNYDRPTTTGDDLQKQEPRDSFRSSSTLFLAPHPPSPPQTGNKSPVASSPDETTRNRKGRKFATTEDGKVVVGRIKSLLERVELDDVIGEASGSDIEDVVRENEKFVAAVGENGELVLEDQSHQPRREPERDEVYTQPQVKPEIQCTNGQNLIDLGAFDDESRTRDKESINVNPTPPEKTITTDVDAKSTSDVSNLLDLVQFDDDLESKLPTSRSTSVSPETDDSHKPQPSAGTAEHIDNQSPHEVSADSKLCLPESKVVDVDNGYEEEAICSPSAPPASPAAAVPASPPPFIARSGIPLDDPVLSPALQNGHQKHVNNTIHESETAADGKDQTPGPLITITINADHENSANDNDRTTTTRHLEVFDAESNHPDGSKYNFSPDVITKRVEVPDASVTVATAAATVVNGDDVPTQKFVAETRVGFGHVSQFRPESPTADDKKTRLSFNRSENSNVKTNGDLSVEHSNSSSSSTNDINSITRSTAMNNDDSRSKQQSTGSSVDRHNDGPVTGSTKDIADRTSSSSTSFSQLIDLVLNKDCVGLGFCIEGGAEYSGRKTPVTIKRLFKGETWAKGHLEAGDELLQVNGVNLDGMSHNQAWTHLKSLPDGIVTIRIRRKVTKL